ncbi:hypothetical protein [Runella zeae]|uniref:hypothetical protein n=1 Tax=Runella zeae TaxID=94255 RepID=UPI002355CC8E|nr:hypothetical protein [Runella zeae]
MFPITYTIEGQTKTAWGASTWAEVEPKNFLPLIRTIYAAAKTAEVKYQIPLLASNINKDDYLKLNQVQSLQLVAHFDFLLDFVDLPTKWYIDSIPIRHIIKGKYMPLQVLHGPAERLKNVCFEEFIYAESYFSAYSKSKKESDLNMFCAILFRPKTKAKKYNGDVREPFDRHSVEKRAEVIAKIDNAVKQAIVLNYVGAKSTFPKMYKWLFSSDEDQEKNAAQASFSWLEVAYRMAEHKPSEMQVLKRQDLHEVLSSLNLKVKDNEALKEELEAMRRKNTR